MSVPEKQAFVQYFFLYALKLKACFANCCRFYLVVSGKWRTFAPSSALVVELVDTPDLGSGAFGRVSSSLIRRTSEGTFVVPSFVSCSLSLPRPQGVKFFKSLRFVKAS